MSKRMEMDDALLPVQRLCDFSISVLDAGGRALNMIGKICLLVVDGLLPTAFSLGDDAPSELLPCFRRQKTFLVRMKRPQLSSLENVPEERKRKRK